MLSITPVPPGGGCVGYKCEYYFGFITINITDYVTDIVLFSIIIYGNTTVVNQIRIDGQLVVFYQIAFMKTFLICFIKCVIHVAINVAIGGEIQFLHLLHKYLFFVYE